MSSIPYCTDHDPLVRAGIITCRNCGRIAYPTDAAWLDANVIMASFPSACDHTRERVWFVDMAKLAQQRMWCHAHTRTTGEPCRNRAGADGRCRVHGDR